MTKQFILTLAFLSVLSTHLMAGQAVEQLNSMAMSPDAVKLNIGFDASRQASGSVQADTITTAPSKTTKITQTRQESAVTDTKMPTPPMTVAVEKPADNRNHFERGYDWAVRPGKEAANSRNPVIEVFGAFLYVALIPVGLAAGLLNSLFGFI